MTHSFIRLFLTTKRRVYFIRLIGDNEMKQKKESHRKEIILISVLSMILIIIVTGIILVPKILFNNEKLSRNKIENEEAIIKKILKENEKHSSKEIDMKIEPETFSLQLKDADKEINLSGTFNESVDNFKEDREVISWTYPKQGLDVVVENQKKFIDVSFYNSSKTTSKVNWPNIEGDSYYLPIGEGKNIPSNDNIWKKYFKENMELDLNEAFSMSFVSVVQDSSAAVIVMDNNFNKQLLNKKDREKLSFEIESSFNDLDKQEALKFRIYLTDSNPVSVAKTYQTDRINQGEFTTLSQRVKENENIEKLFGAPHIYFWQNRILTEKDIDWGKLSSVNEDFFIHIGNLLDKYYEDGRSEFDQAVRVLKKNEAYKYEKNTILTGINTVILYPDFYNNDIFNDLDDKEKTFLEKSKNDLPTEKRMTINKNILKEYLKDIVSPIDSWGQSTTTDIIKDMKNSGIDSAWLGLANWNQGLINPSFVKEAVDSNYLIGPYDSYQSIHSNPSIDWNTAGFRNNEDVFNSKTIIKSDGEFVSGFLGKGRKVNQTLIEDEAKYRLDKVLTNEIPFNSWFVDTDAAGEIYNDYSPDHKTSIQQDIDSRIARTKLWNDKGLVVGTETGNDYFNKGMVFAHGIETPVIAWSDEDMRENKESKYYVGGYASMDDTIPERYSKQVPLKKEYKAIYIDPQYNIPLYKLVYNQSVITTHHWEWDSYKIKDEVKSRRLTEYLYNVPPLFHLDSNVWSERKDDIVTNSQIWNKFQKEALLTEMTNFEYLSDNKLIQKTNYGETLSVLVNYSEETVKIDGIVLKPQTGVIELNGKQIVINE